MTARETVERYGDMVWRLALARTADRHDAEDVFQEVFLRYIRHAHRLADEDHRRAWLIRCTINCSKSLLAAPWRRSMRPFWPCPRSTAPPSTSTTTRGSRWRRSPGRRAAGRAR